MSFLIAQSLINGVILGTLYLLMAIGFTLAFGVMRIVNFAHGEFYMVGAFCALIGVTWLGLPFPVTLALTIAVAILLGALVERVVFRPFRNDELSGMIASLGLAMILQHGALILFGPDPQAFPALVSGVFKWGALIVPKSRAPKARPPRHAPARQTPLPTSGGPPTPPCQEWRMLQPLTSTMPTRMWTAVRRHLLCRPATTVGRSGRSS